MSEVICRGWESCSREECTHRYPHTSYRDAGLCDEETIWCDFHDLEDKNVKCIPYMPTIIDVDELFEEIDI